MWTLSFTVSKKAVKRWEYGWAATYTTYKCKQSKPRLLLIKRMPNWVQSTLGAHYQQHQNHWLFPAGSEAKGACQQVLEWLNWCTYQSSWIWESYQKWHFQAKFDDFFTKLGPRYNGSTLPATSSSKIIDSFQQALLKVSKFQNEFMKSSFLPKYEQKMSGFLPFVHIFGETMAS